MRTWNIREAFLFANVGLLPIETDLRLNANERAIAGELRQANTTGLNTLRADDTWPTGQRQARYQNIVDKVFALETVDKTHAGGFAVAELYDLYELSQDAATAGRDGLTTFVSGVGS